jgi:hypothetical protein
VDGVVTFTLPTNKVKDAAGNSANSVTSTTGVTVDNTPPTFDSWSYVSGTNVYVSGSDYWIKP